MDILDSSIAQSRPRFLAYIGSSGLEVGAIADFLTSSYDINHAIDSKASTLLEEQTAKWVSEFIGYGEAIGYFTSGGMVSNLTALATARSAALPNSRKAGNYGKVAIYASSESHYSVSRAVEVLGIGTDALRLIPIDENHRMSVRELEKQIERDLVEGVIPIAIVATGGTTLTGAVDSIDKISEVARSKRFGCMSTVPMVFLLQPLIAPIYSLESIKLTQLRLMHISGYLFQNLAHFYL